MSTLAKDALDVDELLEQVAIAMTSGGYDTALKLLPQIMTSGDDIQRQMAESYKMQLEALIAMEQEAAELAELLDGDDESDALPDSETTDHDEGLLENLGDNNGDVLETMASESTANATAVLDNADDEGLLESLSDSSDVLETMAGASTAATTAVLDNADSEAVVTDNTSAGDNEDNTETLEFTAREREIDTALEQVAVLISEGEYETADIILQSALVKGNTAQRELAKTYEDDIKTATAKASDEKQSITAEAVSSAEPPQTQTPESDTTDFEAAATVQNIPVEIDALEELTVESIAPIEKPAEDNINQQQKSNSVLDRLFSDEEPDSILDQIFADAGPSRVSNGLFGVDSAKTSVFPSKITTNSAEPSVPLTESVAIDSTASDVTTSHDNGLLKSLDDNTGDALETLTNDTTVEVTDSQAALENTSEETLSPDTGSAPADKTEIFSDSESVEGLLPPSQALGAFAIADVADLPEQSASTEVRSQRQGFLIGDVGLMVDFSEGSQLTEMPTCYRVPNAPDWLTGLTNLHGVVIPVFDLQKYFDLHAKDDKNRMLMVLQHGEKAIGVIVNGLPVRLSYRESQRMNKNTSPSSLSQYIQSAYLIDQRLWFELDSTALTRGLEQAMA